MQNLYKNKLYTHSRGFLHETSSCHGNEGLHSHLLAWDIVCSIMVVLPPSGRKMEAPGFSQMLVAINKAAAVFPDKNITI